MGFLGINVPGRAEVAPADLATFGAEWLRCVAYRDYDLSDWIRQCRNLGMKVLLVLGSESIGGSWDLHITTFRDRYGPLVDAYQLGNESDHTSPSSWTLVPEELNMLLRTGRERFGPDVMLIGPGLVSGDPNYADKIDWSPVQALAVHPYGQRPEPAAANWEQLPGNFNYVGNLLDGYRRHGRPVWVTEFGVTTTEVSEAFQARYLAAMVTALLGQDLTPVAMPFCWSDNMVPRFGLVGHQGNKKDAYKAVHAAALAVGAALPPPGPPTPLPTPPPTPAPTPVPPAPTQPAFRLGFAEWAKLEPALLGAALEDEEGFAPGVSLQSTTTGELYWVDARERIFGRYGAEVDLAECYGFKERASGRRYRWRKGWVTSQRVGA